MFEVIQQYQRAIDSTFEIVKTDERRTIKAAFETQNAFYCNPGKKNKKKHDVIVCDHNVTHNAF